MNKIICGDAIEEMKKLPENSVDAIITDPPYGLEFMGKEWDKFKKSTDNIETEKKNPYYRSNIRHRIKEGISNPALQQFVFSWAIECLRVLKPGGYLLSFGGTRTYHRMTCGIEDAGFEIRDTIMWLYGSGFPKSMDIGQDFDRQECRRQLIKKLGRKPTRDEFKESWKDFRKVVGIKQHAKKDFKDNLYAQAPANKNNEKVFGYGEEELTIPQTPEAKEWEGWGTALKPACEPIVVARKPLSEKNVALNVLKWGTGGINIDESRIGTEIIKSQDDPNKFKNFKEQDGRTPKKHNYEPKEVQGRFPANIILECICDKTEQGQEKISGGFGAMDIGMSDTGKGITQKYDPSKSKSKEGKFMIHTDSNCPCYMLDKQSGESKSSKVGFDNVGWKHSGNTKEEMTKLRYQQEFKDKGGASRFFYCAKASKSERNFGLEGEDYKSKRPSGVLYNKEEPDGFRDTLKRNLKNNHPTVKPIKLIEYLIKLVSRERATILDPFIGSGTTAIACLKLNRNCIGIEKEPEYVKIAEARIKPFLEQSKLN